MKKIIDFIGRTPVTKLCSSLLILAMAVIMFMNVVLRYVFGFSFNWGDEILRYMCIYMAFFGIAAGWRHGKHISITVVIEHLVPQRARKYFRLLSDVASIAFMGLLVYYGVILVQKVAASGQSSTALRLPMAAVYAIVPLCGVVSIVHILVQIFVGKTYLEPRE